MLITETNLRNKYTDLKSLKEYAYTLFSEFENKTIHRGIIVPKNYGKKFKQFKELSYEELIKIILFYNREKQLINSHKESKVNFKKMSDLKTDNIKIEHVFKTDFSNNNTEYFVIIIGVIFLLIFVYAILKRQK